MSKWNNDNNTPTVDLFNIIKTLREMVKRVVKEFQFSSSLPLIDNVGNDEVIEAIPISFRLPEPTNMDMTMLLKKRVTTLLVGETLVSFQLPNNCPFDARDLDMLVKEEWMDALTLNINKESIYNVPRYSFLERLNGWKLERRQRANGRFDMFYHHLQSRTVFRSITEVVNFLMHEVNPYHKLVQKSAAISIGEDNLSEKRGENKETRITRPLKRKFEDLKKPIFDLNVEIEMENDQVLTDESEKNAHDHYVRSFDLNQNDDYESQVLKEELTVDKFMGEAYQNLMNVSDHTPKSKSFHFDINEEIVVEDHTVGDFMAQTYNNVVNFENNEPNPRKDNGKDKGKEKMTNLFFNNESYKRFKINDVNQNVILTDHMDSEPSYVATTSKCGIETSSTVEVTKSDEVSPHDECDLINHIQESSDIFDLALFLAKNRGENGGF